MKILVVSTQFPLSRDEVGYSFIFDEASKLSNSDVTIHVARGVKSILNRKKDMIVNKMYVHNYDGKIDISTLPSIMKVNYRLLSANAFHPYIIRTLRTLLYSCFIIQLVERYEIDVIHAHFAYPEGLAALLAKNFVRKPFILTLHGYDIITEPLINYGIRLKKRYDILVRKILSKADRVFAASRYVYWEALNAGCSQERLVYLPNGVDLKRFNPDIDGFSIRRKFGVTTEPIIFTLRGHVPKNGIEYLIKAVPTVLKEVPDAVFVIGGSGPLMAYHKGLAAQLGLRRQIHFIKYIPPDELPYYYAASDVFIIPSVIEAFGLVAAEATACGKPVIGAKTGGIPDIVREELNGCLVEPRDAKSIADKIVFLLRNPALTQKMGVEGRKIAKRHFDIEKRVQKILDIYHELVYS